MVKKAIFGLGAMTVLAVLLLGRDAASYFGTSFGWVKSSVKNSVPVEFEIERARQMVQNLVPDIRRNMHVIAQEEVEVEKLEKQIASTEATLTRDRAELLRLKTDLATGQSTFQYAGRSYGADEVKVDLANRFERFKTHDSTHKSLREILDARKRSLQAARKKLEGMFAAKRKLEVDVENLEARLKMVEVAQTTSDYNFDDSQLARAKDLIGDVRTRLNVAERLVHAESTISDGGIPLSEPASHDIVDQVTDYFSPRPEKVAKVERKQGK